MPDLRVKALQLLTRRDHSRAELHKKLAPLAESEDALEAILDALQAERLLSDSRFASQRASQRGSRYGTFAGQAEISQHLKRVVRGYLDKRGKVLADDQMDAMQHFFHAEPAAGKVGDGIEGCLQSLAALAFADFFGPDRPAVLLDEPGDLAAHCRVESPEREIDGA